MPRPNYKLTGTLTTRYVLHGDGSEEFTRYDDRRHYRRRRLLRLLHARSTAVWATCYVYVTAVPRALRCYAPGIIQDYFILSGIAANILLAILLYGYWLR